MPHHAAAGSPRVRPEKPRAEAIQTAWIRISNVGHIVDPSKKPVPNVLDRDFTASAPNRKWVADITYLRTEQGWGSVAVVLDLFSRKVVGW